jgi:putrescine transport system substrate-binding protein
MFRMTASELFCRAARGARMGALMLAALVLAALSALAGCGHGDPARPHAGSERDARVVNLYTWADYLGPNTLADFERETGIKVRVAYFDTNETLESRMLTGSSGYDVVVPTAPYLQRQIAGGAYRALDKRLLPNLANLDPALMARAALNDPGNAHSVIYTWGTYGIGFNVARVAKALPGVPLDSWRLLFDPTYARRLASCGISTIDAPAGVERLVLQYLGRDPNTPTAADLAQVASVLTAIRPYIRTIDSANMIDSLANGDICIALGYNGDFVQARNRARDSNNGNQIAYIVPKEGSLIWFDMLAIPTDAPHPANAHALINYLMNPRTIADISNYIGYANANRAATPLLAASIAADPAIFPPAAERERLFVETMDDPEQLRLITRLWQRFKTAQ